MIKTSRFDVKAMFIAPPTTLTVGVGDGSIVGVETTVAIADSVGEGIGEETMSVATASCGDETGSNVEVEANVIGGGVSVLQSPNMRRANTVSPPIIQ